MFKKLSGVTAVRSRLGGLRLSAGMSRAYVALMVLAFGVMGTSSAWAAVVTIPDSGADVAAYITAAITALGSVVAVAVGGYFAFLIVRLGLRWSRRLAG